MIRPIFIIIDNTIEMARFSSCLKDSIVEIINYCKTNPYMLDSNVSFVSFEGKILYKTTIDKFEEGNISLRLSSNASLDGGVISILNQSENNHKKSFAIIITCGKNSFIRPSTIKEYKTSYTPFVVVCLEQNCNCDWVKTLTNNPRVFHTPLTNDRLNNMFVVPTFYINDNRDPNYIATV